MTPLIKILFFTFLAGIFITLIKSKWQKPESWFVAILQNFVGSLLIFSGAVKAVDPLGTAYKMKDYFDAFSSFTGISFDWLANASVFLAVFMIVLEVLLGVALIIVWRNKLILGLTAAMMIFFTILTGFTYLTGFINPDFYDLATRNELKTAGESIQVWTSFDPRQMKVTDCGCFGDFLKLEPKESFLKDIFFLIILGILFFGRKGMKPFFGSFFGNVKIAGTTIAFLIFCFSNYMWSLPMFDFRPYKIGNNIPAQMETIKPAKFDYKFIYKNKQTGETVELTQDELKGFDYASFEYVDRKEKLIDPGIPAKINNFGAYNEEGFDMTDEVINNENFSFWVLSKDLKKSKKEAWENLSKLSILADEEGFEMFAFMTSSFTQADDFRHENQQPYPFYQADETFIKTVVRANPGLVLLKNGVVIGKWHHTDIPSIDEMKKYLEKVNK